MIYTQTSRKTTLPATERGQLWKDTTLNITYKLVVKLADGWHVKCISNDSGNVWHDTMPFECFANELTLVN